jgi:hypothetical protein
VFFWYADQGAYLYNREGFVWIFDKMSPAVDDGRISFTTNPQLGWGNNKLYVSVDWTEGGSTTRRTLIYDPTIAGGAWITTDIDAAAMYSYRPPNDSSTVYGACVANTGVLIDVEDEQNRSTDRYASSAETHISSYFVTRWVSGKNPIVKKRWGRPRLVTSLRRHHHPVALRRYFNTFCASYAYLPYFFDQLRRCRPKTVLVSNDHNVSNRALMAVARALKIPVAYLQHASVSPLFPPLRVDYAFLDGEASLATYRLCENNPLASADGEPVTVFLSGQKKDVRNSIGPGEFVALAINKIDPVDQVLALVRHLLQKGERVKLRWHPAQPAADVQTPPLGVRRGRKCGF